MRGTLQLLSGSMLAIVGLVLVITEITRGQDIFRRHSAIGIVVLGGLILARWAGRR